MDCKTHFKLILLTFFLGHTLGARYLTRRNSPGIPPDERATFVIEVNKPELIEEADNILALPGIGSQFWHFRGKIIKEPAPYNPPWSFHLDPTTIGFGQYFVEVCDAGMEYLEENLDEACGAFLPNCIWCPWDAVLVQRLEDDYV